MTTQLPTVEQVSEAFRAKMLEELKPALCRLVDETNAARGEDGTCATHDWCDANEVMDDALKSLGVHMYPEQEDWPDDWNGPEQAVVDLWNAAWTHARRAGFSPARPA